MTPEILDLLFPNKLPSVEEIEKRYPPRPEGQMVVRIAPSPTGYMHVGTLYVALLDERTIHQRGGVFYLRIEDTDQERYVPEAVPIILKELDRYGLTLDEGPQLDGTEKGAYGPYTQSKRKEIYQAFVKKLVAEGKAYPCFCTSEEVNVTRKIQEKLGVRPGYHGKYAKCRNLSDSQVLEKLHQGLPFVIRIRSTGDYNKKRSFKDLFKGVVQMPEYDLDVVIMKQDGLPTYHFAHLIDDHLMGTTHVTRTDEWLSSLPLHVQLFEMMGWKVPEYAHFAPIQKLDNGNKRKISKRHDPEANVAFFAEKGYPTGALIEYLMNLISSGFEDWRRANPDTPAFDYPIGFDKVTNVGGALFDFVKLNSVSKEVIARMTADEVYQNLLTWAKDYNPEFLKRLEQNKDYIIRILGIERLIGPKSRKDLIKWEDVPADIAFFFKEDLPSYKERIAVLEGFDLADIQKIAKDFIATFDINDDKDTWFAKVKQVGEGCGFAPDNKTYKQNPTAYKGNVSDTAKILRVLVTGRTQTPDLWSIMQILGKDEVIRRLTAA